MKIGKYEVEDAAVKAASWHRIDSGNNTQCEYDEYRKVLRAGQTGDDSWWDGIEAEGVPATGPDGKPCEITISVDVANDGDSHIFVNFREEVEYAESGDGERISAYEIAQTAGYDIGGRMKLDYWQATVSFIEDHPDARYIMHNQRGFANEWVLWVCESAEEAREAKEAAYDWTEYDSVLVRGWLREGIMEKDDYKALTGLDKCCAVKFWRDH